MVSDEHIELLDELRQLRAAIEALTRAVSRLAPAPPPPQPFAPGGMVQRTPLPWPGPGPELPTRLPPQTRPDPLDPKF